jgi:transcriptional regulator with XRE-family HTH domain
MAKTKKPRQATEPEQVTIGTRLKFLRKAHGFTATMVAKKIGCTKAFISAIELDKSMPTLKVAAGLATLYDVSVDFLIYGSAMRQPTHHAVAMVHESTAIKINELLAEAQLMLQGLRV